MPMSKSDDRNDADVASGPNVTPFLPRDEDHHDDADREFYEELNHLFDVEAEDDEFFAEWDEADAEAVELLRESLPEIRDLQAPQPALRSAAERIRAGIASGSRPYSFIPGAAGWTEDPPADDRELWIMATGSLLAGMDDFPMPIEELSTIMALEHGDWVGAVLGLVRAGVGAPAGPADLARYADECPEVEGETDPEDAEIIEAGFGHLLELWQATGAVDERSTSLTDLGHWGLPRALAWAWQGDFDA